MISDSAAGVIKAAPRPCPARAPISTPAFAASPLVIDAIVKIGDAGEEHLLAGEHVGDPAAEQQAAAGGQQVRRDQPLQRAAPQVE